jgi:hypothetical protein
VYATRRSIDHPDDAVRRCANQVVEDAFGNQVHGCEPVIANDLRIGRGLRDQMLASADLSEFFSLLHAAAEIPTSRATSRTPLPALRNSLAFSTFDFPRGGRPNLIGRDVIDWVMRVELATIRHARIGIS